MGITILQVNGIELEKTYDYTDYDCSFNLVYNAKNDNVFVSMADIF